MNDLSLRRTVEKVISQTEHDLINSINASYNEALNKLRTSKPLLENEYNKIIEDANKQADNLKRQIIGSASINTRNKQLLVVESAIQKVFEETKKRIDNIRSSEEYISMLNTLLNDAINVINGDMIIECNNDDMPIVNNLVDKLATRFDIIVSDKPINILGGIRAISKDGSIIYENTLERRIERLKPLIKKDIVGLFVK
jgi:V/A-type H+-transporting ATPase subunit E